MCTVLTYTGSLLYLQLGHVACSSLRRESARRWIKHPAHIRCPLVHCDGKKELRQQSNKVSEDSGKNNYCGCYVGGGTEKIATKICECKLERTKLENWN